MRVLFRIAIAAVLSVPAALHAQSWPSKPIRLIVNTTPGGSVDIIARTFSPRLGSALGQPVIVDNRGGGGGIVGVSNVAKSPPDGYTLLHCSGSLPLLG